MKQKVAEMPIISARVSEAFKKMIQKYIEMDTHVTESDLVRDAVREKIEKNAPFLLEEMIAEQNRKRKSNEKNSPKPVTDPNLKAKLEDQK